MFKSLLAKLALIVMVFTFIGGIGGLVTGITDYREARQTKPQPQVITAANLAAHGAGSNHFVQITEVAPRIDSIVVEGGNRKTFWETAYIPLVSDKEVFKATDPPRIILVSKTVKNQATLDALANTRTITGMASNYDVDAETKSLLKGAYPKMDTSKCVVVNHDQTPPSKGGSMVCMIIGVILLTITLALGITARRGKWGEHFAPKKLSTFGVNPLFQPPSIQPQPPPRLAPLPMQDEQKRP